jgi:hypothetical protein
VLCCNEDEGSVYCITYYLFGRRILARLIIVSMKLVPLGRLETQIRPTEIKIKTLRQVTVHTYDNSRHHKQQFISNYAHGF